MAVSKVLERMQPAPTQERIPWLENGDHLTRAEFERRYAAMPEPIKAELIEGVVYMSSPARYSVHAEPHALIMGWLAQYVAATPGTSFADNSTVRVDADNEVQPDALLRIRPESGGQSQISADDYLEGAPELVIEIAASTVSHDLYEKLKIYRRNRVQEYIVWRTQDQQLDWFQWQEGKYEPLAADEQGTIHSQVFPGLVLAVNELLEGDLAAVLARLQKGIATPEHQAFVQRLTAQSQPNQ